MKPHILSVSAIFDHYAEDYDKWFDTPEGKVLFGMEIEAVRLLIKDIKNLHLKLESEPEGLQKN